MSTAWTSVTPPGPSCSSTSICRSFHGKPFLATSSEEGEGEVVRKRVLQVALWVAEAVYILCSSSFLMLRSRGPSVGNQQGNDRFPDGPFSQFLLYIATHEFWVVGIRLIDAPVLHPMADFLFNFVIGWTFMFAPLLFTDTKKDRYRGFLDVLWGLQMFLTNTFLIPYMAIDDGSAPSELSQLGLVMTNGAPIVGLISGGICLFSVLWALFGRMDGDFGLCGKLHWSERLAYAFIWDIVLYTIFQPWLIGSNLLNVHNSKRGIVNYLRFIPVAGVTAYLLFLDKEG